jgi:hypothetical protein
MFYTYSMTNDDIDRVIAARIAEAVIRHVRDRQLSDPERSKAVADLMQAASGRTDLLGEHAGVALGIGERRPDAARYRQIADLCISAGADETFMEHWVNVARLRASIMKARSSSLVTL